MQLLFFNESVPKGRGGGAEVRGPNKLLRSEQNLIPFYFQKLGNLGKTLFFQSKRKVAYNNVEKKYSSTAGESLFSCWSCNCESQSPSFF